MYSKGKLWKAAKTAGVWVAMPTVKNLLRYGHFPIMDGTVGPNGVFLMKAGVSLDSLVVVH